MPGAGGNFWAAIAASLHTCISFVYHLSRTKYVTLFYIHFICVPHLRLRVRVSIGRFLSAARYNASYSSGRHGKPVVNIYSRFLIHIITSVHDMPTMFNALHQQPAAHCSLCTSTTRVQRSLSACMKRCMHCHRCSHGERTMSMTANALPETIAEAGMRFASCCSAVSAYRIQLRDLH